MRAVPAQFTSERDKDIHNSRAQRIHNDHREQQGRDGQHDIRQAHDDVIRPFSKIARHEPEQNTQQHGERGGHQADDEGNPRAIDDAGEHVSAQLVCPEPMCGAGRHEPDIRILGVGVIGRKQRRKGGHQDDKHDKEQRGRGQLICVHKVPDFFPAGFCFQQLFQAQILFFFFMPPSYSTRIFGSSTE